MVSGYRLLADPGSTYAPPRPAHYADLEHWFPQSPSTSFIEVSAAQSRIWHKPFPIGQSDGRRPQPHVWTRNVDQILDSRIIE